MKTALITTTINVPTVLSLYRKCDPDVAFFVAADKKTPFEAYDFCDRLPDCTILSPERQEELYPQLSHALGWNTISRRNIALLEALKWGADSIVTIDDDNLCMDNGYFVHMCHALTHEFSGLRANCRWWDVGHALFPVASHRGIPHNVVVNAGGLSYVVDTRVGVAAGICLGDPDVSATTRISLSPQIHFLSEILRVGIVADPRSTWTVFNSQNTAFIRELAPCFLMVPQFGRYDDIFASLVCQRVMREKSLHVHFGQPFVWQQRNQHDLLKDLRAEQWGAESILKFTEWLDTYTGNIKNVVWDAFSILHLACDEEWMPDIRVLVKHWREAVEKVL